MSCCSTVVSGSLFDAPMTCRECWIERMVWQVAALSMAAQSGMDVFTMLCWGPGQRRFATC